MRRGITFTVIIVIVVILIALIFDFGRKGNDATVLNVSASSTFDQNSSPVSEMLIVVNNIKDNQKVSNPIKITGKARGNWFFEASFPIKLIDVNENVLGTAIAQAEGDWMTTDFVNFTAELEYSKSTSTDRALLILSNDNPSDKPELDKAIYIPVILK